MNYQAESLRSSARRPASQPRGACLRPTVTHTSWIMLALLACQSFAGVAFGLEFAADDPLVNPAALRTASVSDVMKEAPALVRSATAEEKARVRDTMHQVYVAEPVNTARLSFQELQELQRLNRYLSAAEADSSSIVAVWLEQSPAAAELTASQRVWLLDQFKDPAPGVAAVGTLKNRVLGDLHAATAESMTTRQLASAVRALAPHLAESEKAPVLQRLGERWADQIATKTPFNLTDAREAAALRAWQEMFDLLGDYETPSSQYIEHLPEYLAKMTETELYWRFRFEYVELIAQPIRSEAAQDALLAKATGEPALRQDLLQVLSSSYRQTGRHKAWHQYLDRMIADEELSNDQRAQWMIAKAYSLGLTDDTHRPTPLAGLPLMHEAMGLAETDDTRLACLRQIVLGYLGYFMFDAAQSEISRWRADFHQPGSEAIQQLETMITMTQHIADQVAAIENQQ